ncbi:MAG: DUF1566 domain-containing protein [Magnetococcus sp. YQC-9]
MARTATAERTLRASRFHCASVPPAVCCAGILIQGVVPASRADRQPVIFSGVLPCQLWKGEVNGSENTFSGVQTNNYWSSTTNADNTDNAWIVNLNNGNVNNNDKTNNNYVWPVRGGEW